MNESLAQGAWLTQEPLPEPSTGNDGAARWAAVVLDPDTVSVARARRWATDLLSAWDADDHSWLLAQLLTEVATNAVLHARTRFRVTLQQDTGSGRLRCEITDASGVPPRLRRHSLQATTGRGLRIVADLSTAWGVAAEPWGKTIWFELEPGAEAGFDADGQLQGILDGVATLAVPAAEDRTPPDGETNAAGAGSVRVAPLRLLVAA